MHVGLPTYSRRVAELGGDEANGGDDILFPLVLALSFPQLSQHRRRTKSSAPGPEVLGSVRKVRDALDVLVDVARIDVVPLAIFLVTKKPGPRRLHERRDEAR